MPEALLFAIRPEISKRLQIAQIVDTCFELGYQVPRIMYLFRTRLTTQPLHLGTVIDLTFQVPFLAVLFLFIDSLGSFVVSQAVKASQTEFFRLPGKLRTSVFCRRMFSFYL